ncbi:hypothetical protein [Mycobacterium sp. D16Q16]|uniref:hypothetical protein n=1 Tax=Mycobacterium sp. D16Q16 TaxID=1855659 RepID=UPI00158FF815|nr:hypothetical protein [Mycobacterium sp. D16Q16]
MGTVFLQCSVHRGQLQMPLLDAVTERLGADAVRTDTALRGIDDDGDRVTVSTSRGPMTAKVLVGIRGAAAGCAGDRCGGRILASRGLWTTRPNAAAEGRSKRS